MQQNPHENTPPSSPIFSTGTQTTATTVVIPPSSTALPHTFDTKGISDIEPLPESSSLDRRQREEKKMSTITPATTASSSKPEDEEGDSDLDKLLMESPTTTGISVRRHHGTSSLRFGSTHSGYSDSGIFETSSPGSTATHSLARSSTTTSKKKQNIRPVVRDMYSEYTTSTPRSEDAMMVERGKTVLSTISIKLRPTMDASISTDDFYFPLDASVLLPAQSAAPLIMSRATISTPTLPLTTVPFPPSSRSDQQTQTELRPLKTKRKSTKHILLFHPSHYPVKTRVEPVPPHAHGASDQLCAEQTVDLGTSVPAPAGVILVKSTTAATSTAAMEAKPVNQALRETAHGKRKRGEEEEEDMEVPSAAVAIQDPTSAEESADSMEASWYQPHLHLSDKTKRFHKKIRRKYKDAEEDMDIGGEKDSKAEQYVKQKGSGDEKLDFNKGIPKAGINKMEKEGQGEKRVKDQREDITKKDVIEIKEKDIRTPQFDFRIKEHGKYEGNESAERKRNNETTKCKAEADEEQSENRSAKVRKHQKKLKGFNMPQIKIKSKVKTPHEEIKAPMAKKKDVSNEEVKTAEGLKDVGMPVADAHADVDGNVVGGKEKIPSFKVKVPKPHMKVDGKVEAALEMPELSADVPEVSGGLGLPEVDLNLDPDIVPSVAVATPSMKLDAAAVDIDVPKASVELPHVEAKGDISPMEMEVSVPRPEIEVDMAKAKVAVEKELKLPSMRIKAPKFKFGKIGKAKVEGGEVETPQMEVHGEMPRVDVGMPKAEVDVEMPGGKVVVEKDIKSPDFHFKMPKMKFGGKVKKPHVEMETPEVEAHVDVPSVEVGMPEDQLVAGLRNLGSVSLFCDPRFDEISPSSSVGAGVTGSVPSKPCRQFLDLSNGAVSREKNITVIDDLPGVPSIAFDLPSGKFGLISATPSPNEAEILCEPRFSSEINSSSDMTASELESSSQSGSLPISPRDFYAHSTTPEFKRPSGVETIDEECSGTAERKKSEKNMLDWFRLSWRRTKRRRSGVSTSSGVEDGRSLSNTGRRRPKPLKHKKTTVQNTAVTLITSTPVEDEDLGIQADVVPTTQLSVSSPRSKYQRSEEKNAEPALPMEAEVLWAEQKTAEFPVGFSNTRGSTKTKCKKRSTKPTKPDQPLIKDEPNASTPRLRKSSGSLTSERLQRQTWHHPEVAISPIIDANSRTPPKSPLSPRLDDDISEWFSHAYRSHYADTSPLRKPRPWSTLDFPPQNCTFLNDDHLFPYSITPTKLPSCRWKSDKEYDVPYIDDDALPLDEPEWALGESRRTLTLTSADADFWRTAIAEEERSEASGESGWGSKRHLKKCRSLVPYHFKEKNRVQPSRTPRLVKPPVEGTDQFSKRA